MLHYSSSNVVMILQITAPGLCEEAAFEPTVPELKVRANVIETRIANRQHAISLNKVKTAPVGRTVIQSLVCSFGFPETNNKDVHIICITEQAKLFDRFTLASLSSIDRPMFPFPKQFNVLW